MNRKFLSFIIVVIAFCCAGVANAQLRWGATAGVNFNTLKFKQDILTVDQALGEAAGIQGEMMQ